MSRRPFFTFDNLPVLIFLKGAEVKRASKNIHYKLIIAISALFIFSACAAKTSGSNCAKTKNPEELKMFEKIVGYAAIAPSGHNSQPWKFVIEEPTITILPDYSRRLPAVDPDDRELFISLGCALQNLVTSAEHFGYKCNVYYSLEKANSEEIKVTLTKTSDVPELDLFKQIEKRQTTRNEYNKVKVTNEELKKIENYSVGDGVKSIVKTDTESLHKIIQLVKSGNTVQFADDAFMDELKFWIRFSHAEAEEKSDGLTSDVMGNPSIPRWAGKLFMNLFYSDKDQNEKDEKYISSSAGVILFYTEGNSKKDWIETGRAYERFSLLTTSINIKCAFINQPIEVPRFLNNTAEAFGLKNGYPQLLLRFGYSDAMPKSPRRRTADVILSK